MEESFDVIVIGVGAMGAATLWELSRRGIAALGIEQFDVPHAGGSSHGQSRLIRLAYYEHPDYVPLLKRAWARWRLLEREAGMAAGVILKQTGGLYIGPPGSELVAGSARSAGTHGLAHEPLSGREIARRWPVFAGVEGMEGIYEEQAGYLRPEAAIAAFAAEALRRGAIIRARERVVSWEVRGEGAEVRTDRGVYRARRVVITAGPWIGELLPVLREKITVTRQVMTWVWPSEPERFGEGVFPSWCIEVAEGGLVYGPPLTGWGGGVGASWEGGPVGLKVAHHFPGERCAAGSVDRAERAGDWDVVRRTLRMHLPAADGAAMGMKVCLYSNSPDGHFVVDWAEGAERRVLFAGGFSGHGFKFASVMGEVLADLASEGVTKLPVDFLRVGGR